MLPDCILTMKSFRSIAADCCPPGDLKVEGSSTGGRGRPCRSLDKQGVNRPHTKVAMQQPCKQQGVTKPNAWRQQQRERADAARSGTSGVMADV